MDLQCADITFSSTATLLDAGVCKNSTGVGGVALANAGTPTSETTTGSAASSTASGAADNTRVKVGAVVGALAVGVGALML